MFSPLRQMALLVGGPFLIVAGLTTPSQAAPLPIAPSNLRPAPTGLQNPGSNPAFRPGFLPNQPNWVAPVRPNPTILPIPPIGSDPRTWTPWWLDQNIRPYPPYPYPYPPYPPYPYPPYPWGYGQGSQLNPLYPAGQLNPYNSGNRPNPYLPGSIGLTR